MTTTSSTRRRLTTPICEIKRNLPALPNPQAHAERVIQTLKHEVLKAFCVVSERHLDHILHRAADWYNFRRCHSARGNLPPVRKCDDPPVVDLKKQRMVCASELGGHLTSNRPARATVVTPETGWFSLWRYF